MPRRAWLPWSLAAAALAAAIAPACRSDDPAAPYDPGASHGATTGGGAGAGGGSGGAGAAGGAGGGGGGAAAPGGVAILSWNLETFPLTAGASAKVAEIVADLDPDLIGVQDISDAAAFEALPSMIPGYAAILNDDPGAFLRVGLLYKTSRVAISEVETLFPNDWYAFPRPPLKARAVVSLDARTTFDFEILVLHLKAQLDAESQARRLAACQALDVWVQGRLAAGPEQDFVLLGDWNDELTDPAQYNVFQVFLDAPDTYQFLTLPAAQAGDATYIPFSSMIDHVLVTWDALGEYGEGTTSVIHLDQTVPAYENDVSDHRPVLSRFEGSL